MPTINELLEQAKRGQLDTGSCFGVTDQSRLRPAFRRRRIKSPPICDGCEGKKSHHCKKKVRVVWVDSSGQRMKLKRGFVKCTCSKCKKK